MAFFTYRLIKYYKNTEKKRVVREIIEKVINPLAKNLESILNNLPELSLNANYLKVITLGEIWEWLEIKEKYPFLVQQFRK